MYRSTFGDTLRISPVCAGCSSSTKYTWSIAGFHTESCSKAGSISGLLTASYFGYEYYSGYSWSTKYTGSICEPRIAGELKKTSLIIMDPHRALFRFQSVCVIYRTISQSCRGSCVLSARFDAILSSRYTLLSLPWGDFCMAYTTHCSSCLLHGNAVSTEEYQHCI